MTPPPLLYTDHLMAKNTCPLCDTPHTRVTAWMTTRDGCFTGRRCIYNHHWVTDEHGTISSAEDWGDNQIHPLQPATRRG